MSNLESEVFGKIKPKNNNKIIIILIIIVIVILICLISFYLVLNTNLFKSNDVLLNNLLDENFVLLNNFVDEDIEDFYELTKTKNYNAKGSYSVSGQLSSNEEILEALNLSKIAFNIKKDNLNDKCEIDLMQKIDDELINMKYNYSQDTFNFKIDGVDEKYTSIENDNINNLLKNLDVNNSSLYPSKLQNNYSSEKLFPILEDEIKNTISNYKKSIQKVQNNGNNAIALIIPCKDFNNLADNFIQNIFDNESFKTYITTINPSITNDDLTNYAMFLKQKAKDVFNLEDQEASFIVYEAGDMANTIEFRYGSKYIMVLSFDSSSITFTQNSKTLKIEKKMDINGSKIEYNIVGDFLMDNLDINYSYEKTSQTTYLSNLYAVISNGKKSCTYKLEKQYDFEDNIDAISLLDDEKIVLNNMTKNELDSFVSDYKIKLNDFTYDILNNAGLEDQLNPIILSIPGLLLKDGINSNNLLAYKVTKSEGLTQIDNNQESDFNENQDDQNDGEDEIQIRNKDYLNYTYELQDYQSTQNLINKVKYNNYKYSDNADLTIDIYTYNPENFEKGNGNLLSSDKLETQFDLDDNSNYDVKLHMRDYIIDYITIIKE